MISFNRFIRAVRLIVIGAVIPFVLATTASAQTATPYVSPIIQPLDDNGNVVSGGLVFFYEPGTTTKKTTYADAAQAGANANPVVLDASGRATVFLSGTYDIVFAPADDTDPPSSPIWTASSVSEIAQLISDLGIADAANITYTPALAGATIDDVKEGLDNGTFINVAWLGATPDDATVDRVAIQAAIDIAEAVPGGTVYIPRGLFLIDSGLTVQAANVTIAGDGAGSIIRASATQFDLITLSNADGFELRNIQLQGAETAVQGDPGIYGVLTDATNTSSRGKIVGCTFSGATSSVGLNNVLTIAEGCNDWRFDGNYVERLIGGSSGNGYGVLTVADRTIISHNHFIGSAGRGRHWVYLSGSTNSGANKCVVTDNTMTASDYAAITIASSATQVDSSFNLVRGNTITGGNTVTGTEGQISIFGNAHRNRINANTLVNSGSHGIVVHGSLSGDASQAGNNEISNNIVNGADKHGIYLAGTAGTSVVGNRVHEASGESAGTYNAYSIGPDTVTATADTGATFIANRASDSSSTRAAFNIDSSAPTPTSLTLYANHFPELSGGFAISNSGNVVYRQDGQLPNIVGTFTAADATPNIATARYWQTADTTTYTAFDGGIQGDLVYIIFKHTAAIDFTQATLNGNGGVSWTARVGDMAIGVNVDGTNWYFNIVTLDTDT